MDKIKKILNNRFVQYALLLVAGLFIGWIFFGGDTERVDQRETEALEEHDHEGESVWTCSMHPQIRQDEPGQCPICGMDLIPVSSDEEVTLLDTEIQMTEAAMKIADVQTATVENVKPYKEIYLPGKVKADERRIAEITARFSGRIENLFINFTGQKVYKGQKLATIYSPDLVTAQKELFEALKFKESNPSFYNSAVNKLKLWDLTEQQIESIIESGEIQYNFNILASTSGTVVEREVSIGNYVEEGESLFKIANLSKVWVLFDAYESDLPWIQEGDEINFSIQSLPGKTFTSKVTFIDPVIDPSTRVASVRTEVNNPDDQLKPEMFAKGILKSTLPGVENALTIPKSSVLWTGKRAIVYVKKPYSDQPIFEYREVVLGPEAGNQYVVAEGLNAGEEIVANGVFKVDAAAQLQGKVSMMNPGGGKTGTGHDHGDMAMNGEMEQENVGQTLSDQSATEVNDQFKEQLANVLDSYISLKDALVDSDPEEATRAASNVKQALQKVDMSLLKGDAHEVWMEKLNRMKDGLANVTKANLEEQREAFSVISNALYESLKQFKIDGLNAYYQFCPMAFDDTGAYWLSKTKEIRNPYFGEGMMTCGITRDSF